MFRVTDYELYTTWKKPDENGVREKPRTIEFYSQPLHRWLWARFYARYNKTISKMPGFSWVEAKAYRLRQRQYPDLEIIGWGPTMEVKSFFYRRKGRQVLGRCDLTEEMYQKLTKYPSKEGQSVGKDA